MTNNPTRNPFEDDDILSSTIRGSKSIMANSNESFNQYITNSNHLYTPNTSNNTNPTQFQQMKTLFNTMTYTLTHLTKFSFVALAIIATFATSLITAQAFAPTDYKPTTLANNLFNTNKQKDKDPGVVLLDDKDSDVFTLKKCGLNIKIPNKVNKDEITVRLHENNAKYKYEFGVLKQSPMMGSSELFMENFKYNIECEPNILKDKFDIFDQELFVDEQDVKYHSISKNDLIAKNGWFIGNAEIEKVKYITLDKEESGRHYIGYEFYYKTNRFRIYTDTFPSTNKPGFNEFQLQFQDQQEDFQIVAKDPNIIEFCDGLGKIKVKDASNLTIIQNDLKKDGSLHINNQTVQDGVYNPQPDDFQFSIICNGFSYDSMMKSGFDSYPIEVNKIPFNILNILHSKINPNNIYGFVKDETNGTNILLTDAESNNYRIQINNVESTLKSIELK
jgi:hypothetical protein